ncbi:phage tail protein [Streptomyces syringium]|uniref:phage tail protein n=1 Tax=Streptomyces syringium TaxID=76729 RepID=UPI003D8D3CF1
MPEGQIIGRVAVKVFPNTDGFRRDAERQLNRIEQTLKLTVPTKVDMSGASREYLEELRKINARNRAADSRKIRFHTTISRDGMTEAVSRALRQLQEKANQRKIKFRVDDVEVTGDVKLELDRTSADKVKHDLKDWANDISPLTVKVKLDMANGAGTKISSRLQVLTRPRTVPIIPELDNASVAKVGAALAALSGARVLNDVFERLGRTLKNLDKSVPVIGSLALAIAGLASWGLTAASNLAALSASLAQIGPLALLLPGLLGGMAVGLGVSIAAFKDFNKVIPEVKAALSGLQDTISENFWEKAAEPIRTLTRELLPALTAGVEKTATQLGGFFGNFASSLQGKLKPALAQMFTDLAQSIDIAAKGTTAYAGIITTLGRVGTSYLPELAGWFVQISQRFDTFLAKAEADGRLDGWIKRGLTNFKDLGRVLSNTGGILAGIGRAAEAAGGSTLGMMASTLERIHKTVDSKGFQTGLTSVFTSAHIAMSNLATKAGPAVKNLFVEIGQLTTAVLPQIGSTIGTAIGAISSALAQPAVTEGVKSFFTGIQTAVNGLAPAMAPLGQAFGALLQVVGAFAAMLGPLLTAALVPLANAFTALAPSITPIITLLGGTLTGVINQLAPILSGLVPVVGEALGSAFQALSVILPPVSALFVQIVAGVAPLIAQLVAGLAPILPVIAEAFATVLSAVTPLIPIFVQLLEAVIKPLIPVITEVVTTCLPPFAEALAGLAEAVKPLLEALVAVVQFLMPVLAPALAFIAKMLADTVITAIHAVTNIIKGALDIIMGVWNTFAGLFTGDWSRMWEGIKQIGSGIWSLIKGLFQAFIVVAMGGLLKKGMAVMRSLWDAAWGGIRMAGVTIWNAITGLFSGWGSSLAGIGRSMMASIRGVFSAGWAAVKDATSSAMSALRNAVSSGVSAAVSAVRQFPGAARSALSNLGGVLVGAGKALIQGLISGIKSMVGSVKSTLGDLTNKIKDWKGPLPKDKVLLYEAGQVIIGGLVKGLRSRFDDVKKALSQLTDDIPSTASQSLKRRVAADRAELLKLTDQWDMAEQKLKDAKDRLNKLREESSGYADRITDRIVDMGDVTKPKGGFQSIVKALSTAVDKAKRFARMLGDLKTTGLGQTAIDQIAQAGPDAGLAAAESILAAGKGGIDQINRLQEELAQAGAQAGKVAADAAFANGIHIAEGLVKGLESQQAAIEAQMLKIADAMVSVIRRELGIHSPSKVFTQLGRYVGAGFAKGIEGEARRVERAVNAITARPSSADYARAARTASAAVTSGLATQAGNTVTKTLNYYAAPGNSLSSQEELFATANRARMVGW